MTVIFSPAFASGRVVRDEFFTYTGTQMEIWISIGNSGEHCDSRSVNLEIQKEKMVMIRFLRGHKKFTKKLALTIDKC